MKRLWIAATLGLALTGGLRAQDAALEDAYIAARDKFAAKIKKLEEASAKEATLDKERKAAMADLEKRLRALIGDLSVKGVAAKGKINLESLTDGEIGSGMLDALTFSGGAGGLNVHVATEGLAQRWIAAHKDLWENAAKPPQDLESAVKTDEFVSSGVGSDATYAASADLAVTAPEGVRFAHASLGGWTQDIGPVEPTEIVATFIKDGKLYVVGAAAKTRIGKIAACDKIWKDSEARAKKLLDAYQAGGAKDEAQFEKYGKEQERGTEAFFACFHERAPKEPFYAAATREAQALIARIAGR